MDSKLLLDFVGVTFEILTAYLFFRIFLERWRFPRTIVCGTFLLVFICKLGGSYYFTEAWIKTGCSLICYFTLTCCYKGILLQRITMTCFLWLLNVLPEYLVHVILLLIAGNVYAVGTHNIQDYALGLMISKLVAIFLCSFIYYHTESKKEHIGQTLDYKWYLAFLVYPIVTGVILVQNYYLILNNQQSIYLIWFIGSSVLMILSNLIIFQILDEMHRLEKVKLQAELSEQQLLVQEKHYAEMVQKNSTIKKYIHDTKNLLLILQSYIQQGKNQDAIEYLESMLNSIQNDVIEYTGNLMLDTVLSAKIKDAQQKQITIIPAVALYGDINVRTIDLALLLGNALDNAIEATSSVDDLQRKKILLSVKMQRDILQIMVKNPVSHFVQIEHQCIVTSKKESEIHGLGIPNMKAIVQKYSGTFDIRCSETTFTLNIILQNERYD